MNGGSWTRKFRLSLNDHLSTTANNQTGLLMRLSVVGSAIKSNSRWAKDLPIILKSSGCGSHCLPVL
jgi:hypothetical protein